MEERECYSIGETALITGISAKTLRYYDSLKLIIPEIRDPKNNYRYYSNHQVIQLLAVQRLRMMGCSQKMIRTILQEKSLESLRNQIELRIHELEGEILDRKRIIDENLEFLQQLNATLEFRESTTELSSKLLDNIHVEEIPTSYLFCERRMMPNYSVYDTSVNFRMELYSRLKELGLEQIGPEITTYYTNLLGQFVMQDCEIQIGITVKRVPDCEEIQEFGGFTAVTAIHKGSYETMVNTHMAMLRWIHQNGYEVNGYVSEEFMMSPIAILEQNNQIIKVIMPVKKAADKKSRSRIY